MTAYVTICTRCGRGFPYKPSCEALIDSMPVWWMADPMRPGKMIEGPRCDGRLMRVNRQRQIEIVWADDGIVPASEVEVL